MNRNNRVFAGIIAVVITMSMVVGCGTNAETEVKVDPTDSNAGTSKKPITISWYQNNFAGTELKTMGEAGGFKEIAKNTGVEIDWQHPTSGDQFNVMLASGQYPGVIFWNISSLPKGLRGLVDDGVAIKLNDLIDQYAPNYKKVLEQYPDIKKYTVMDDGTMAAFYQIDPDPRRLAYTGFIIRQDWLDKLKLQVPTTIEEWHTVLKAFKEQDPNGNGKADELPYILPKAPGGVNVLGGASAGLTEFASAWGILDGFYKDPATGKLAYGILQPQFKEFLTTMSSWYQEGLIDSEYASTDTKGRDMKLQSNLAGATYSLIGGGIGNNIAAARPNNPDFSLVGVEMPIGPAGKSYAAAPDMIQKTGYAAIITKDNKNPIETVKMIDYMYSEEGRTLLNWGIEGQSYSVKDGKKQFTDEIINNTQGKNPRQAVSHYAFPINGFTKVMDFEAFKQINLILPEQQEAAEKWAKGDISLLTPVDLNYSTEESAELSAIMNDINTYKDETILKFIMGVEPVSKYEEFRQKLIDMGIEKAQKIYQAALDRFDARQ